MDVSDEEIPADLADQANDTYNVARNSSMRGMSSAYNTAREYPGTIAAIVRIRAICFMDPI